MIPLHPPPPRIQTNGAIAWGRYNAAIADPNVSAPLWRLKEWQYHSIATDQVFFAVGIVQLGYVANAFAYAVDLNNPKAFWEFEALLPLGIGVDFSQSSVAGQTSLAFGKQQISVLCSEQGWQIQCELFSQNQMIELDLALHAAQDQSLALVHAVGEGQVAYTHKLAGLCSSGSLVWQGKRFNLDGLATVDWTRSHAARVTRWKWASLVARLPHGRRLGLNLSADVYDNSGACSQENALWLDGCVQPLGKILFVLPEHRDTQDWHLTGPDIDLTFTPMGARRSDVDFGLVKSQFIQPFGVFNGQVHLCGTPIAVENAIGVVEDHLAVW